VVEQLPRATLVSIDGAAHAINFSHPDQLANVAHAFMDDRPIVDVRRSRDACGWCLR
jgi:hypothetical protein